MFYNDKNTEKVERIKLDRKAIGGHQKEEIRKFQQYTYRYDKEICLYLVTDGLIDLPGMNKQGKKIKYGTRNWINWIKR